MQHKDLGITPMLRCYGSVLMLTSSFLVERPHIGSHPVTFIPFPHSADLVNEGQVTTSVHHTINWSTQSATSFVNQVFQRVTCIHSLPSRIPLLKTKVLIQKRDLIHFAFTFTSCTNDILIFRSFLELLGFQSLHIIIPVPTAGSLKDTW